MERHLPTIIAVAAVAIVLGACGSDGPVANVRPTTTIAGGIAPAPTDAPAAPDPDPVAPEPELPAPEQPAPEPEPPAPAPPAPEPPAPEPPDDNPIVSDADDGIDMLVALLVIGGVLLAIIVIGALIKRSRKSPPEPTTPTPSPQSSLLSTSQWITDQLSLELMAAPPAAALQRWAIERSRLDNVAIGAQQQYLEADDANWQPLAQTMSTLAAALDTNLALRAQDPPNAQLINESTDVVNRQRAAVQQLNAALWSTIPH